jgi:hypothetical protein
LAFRKDDRPEASVLITAADVILKHPPLKTDGREPLELTYWVFGLILTEYVLVKVSPILPEWAGPATGLGVLALLTAFERRFRSTLGGAAWRALGCIAAVVFCTGLFVEEGLVVPPGLLLLGLAVLYFFDDGAGWGWKRRGGITFWAAHVAALVFTLLAAYAGPSRYLLVKDSSLISSLIKIWIDAAGFLVGLNALGYALTYGVILRGEGSVGWGLVATGCVGSPIVLTFFLCLLMGWVNVASWMPFLFTVCLTTAWRLSECERDRWARRITREETVER